LCQKDVQQFPVVVKTGMADDSLCSSSHIGEGMGIIVIGGFEINRQVVLIIYRSLDIITNFEYLLTNR
jgi:hypothetical protein